LSLRYFCQDMYSGVFKPFFVWFFMPVGVYQKL
jgi:hypothetical protein